MEDSGSATLVGMSLQNRWLVVLFGVFVKSYDDSCEGLEGNKLMYFICFLELLVRVFVLVFCCLIISIFNSFYLEYHLMLALIIKVPTNSLFLLLTLMTAITSALVSYVHLFKLATALPATTYKISHSYRQELSFGMKSWVTSLLKGNSVALRLTGGYDVKNCLWLLG
jgi:hypothetical protein